jgi:predicted Zn-dependent protease
LQVLLLSRTGDEPKAAKLAMGLLNTGNEDPDLLRAAYYLGMRTTSPELAIKALQIRIKNSPLQAADGWLLLGKIYETPNARSEEKAFQSYKSALAAAPTKQRDAVLEQIPPKYRNKVQ